MSFTREQLQSPEWVAEAIARIRDGGWFETRTDAERDATLREALSRWTEGDDLWVFGYGSLMWNPIVHFVEERPGLVHGYRRRFCFWVRAGRGSPEMPGLMLGLDKGGSCRGMGFRIAAEQVREELAIMWKREMLSGVYQARWVRCRSAQGDYSAITFVVDRSHEQYIPRLDLATAARHIARAGGWLGTGRNYLDNTIDHLAARGFEDSYLTRLNALVEREGVG